jgi:hypothetical protein
MLKIFYLTIIFIFINVTGITQNELQNANGTTIGNPSYIAKLSLIEFSILNGCMVDGIGKYKGNIKLEVDISYLDNQVTYFLKTTNEKVFEVLNLYVAQKSIELIKVVDLNNPSPNDKITLSAIATLSGKLDFSLKNPIWDIQKLTGIVTKQGDSIIIKTNDNKLLLSGEKVNEANSLINKHVVLTGYRKEPGKIELTSIFEKELNTLDLFVMSQCPYGTKAVSSVLERLDKLPETEKFNLRIKYIFYKKNDQLVSLHGESEITENCVQMILRDNYPDIFIRYLKLRMIFPDHEWKSILKSLDVSDSVISKIEIEVVANRKSLIQREYEYTSTHFPDINASPTYVWESEIVKNPNDIPGLSGKMTVSQEKCNY